MKLKIIIDMLEKIAPLHLAEKWDNVGLLLNPLDPRVIKKIILTIDLTEAVANEAILNGADLIISYHPILFRPAQRLHAHAAADRMLMKLIQHNIPVYSPHTALDAVTGGVNDWLAQGVGIGDVSILQPIPDTDTGQGRLVTLAKTTSLEALCQRLKSFLKLDDLRIARPAEERPIKTVALCAGAGSDAFKGIEADCLLTGEMSHHSVLAAVQNGSSVILCEHTNTERGFLPVFAKKLQAVFPEPVDIQVSAVDTDPLQRG